MEHKNNIPSVVAILSIFSIVVVLSFYLYKQSVLADTDGPNNPGTDVGADSGSCSNNTNWGSTGSPGGTNENDSTNVSINNNNFDILEFTDELRVHNFGFSGIAGTVDGILVEVLAWEGNAATGDIYTTVQLFTAPGTNVGDNKATGALATSDPGSTYTEFGSITDDWSAGLTPAQVMSSDFGVALCFRAAADDSRPEIDHVRITVTFTPPSTNNEATSTAKVSSGRIKIQGGRLELTN